MAKSKYHLRAKNNKAKFKFCRKKNHEVKELMKVSA